MSEEVDTAKDLDPSPGGTPEPGDQPERHDKGTPQDGASVDYRARYAGAVRGLQESQRIIQELQARLHELEQKKEEYNPSTLLSSEELKQLEQARFSEDYGTVEKLEALREKRRLENWRRMQQEEALKNQDLTLSLQFLQQHQQDLEDPNSPLARRYAQIYQEIYYDPVERAGFKDEVINVSGQPVNPHIAKAALARAKAELKALHQKVKTVETGGEEIEPSTPGPATPRVDLRRLLSPLEWETIRKIQRTDPAYSAKDYWEDLERAAPGIQKARIEKGRPIPLSVFRKGVFD